jgi:hypothetical protein
MFQNLVDIGSVTSKDVEYFKKYKNYFSCQDNIVNSLIYKYEGCSIGNGIFRFHTFGSAFVWNNYIGEYFKDYSQKIICFGFDWMGRQFCKSNFRDDIIYLFDPATGEVFEQIQTIQDFFNGFADYKVELFNEDFFKEVIKRYENELELKNCFGFKVPLFLDGKDEIENYELIDMEVYWNMSCQLYNKVNNLPGGALINKVSI